MHRQRQVDQCFARHLEKAEGPSLEISDFDDVMRICTLLRSKTLKAKEPVLQVIPQLRQSDRVRLSDILEPGLFTKRVSAG